jgi:4-hydroxybenzoate polyprenyltransferase
MSLISAGIAVASVVVNDYFDLKLDTTNAPDKPLPSGNTPSLYTSCIFGNCCRSTQCAECQQLYFS